MYQFLSEQRDHEGKLLMNRLASRYNLDEIYVNVKWYDLVDYYSKVVKFYGILEKEGLSVAPKLLEHGLLRTFKLSNSECKICYFVTERHGESLQDMYNLRGGPGVRASEMLEDKYLFTLVFPPEIPGNYRKQIKKLLRRLLDIGWDHADVHPGNFLIKDDVVKVIEFERMKKV